MADPLYLHETDEPEFYVERRNATTGALEPATGLLTLAVSYSLTEEGAAIHSSLSQSLVERAGNPGTYHAAILGTDKAAHLTLGTTVYRRCHDGPVNIDTSHPMVVREVRTV